MNTQPETFIIVNEEKKKRRGLIWIAAGAALLLAGGSTFALWSAQDSFTGGTITSGDLNITTNAAEGTTFYDVSADRSDQTTPISGTTLTGHRIDNIATWKMVPGDRVAASFDMTTTLDGDNLVGRISASGFNPEVAGAPGLNLVWQYAVYYVPESGDAVEMVAQRNLQTDPNTPTNLFWLSAPPAGQDQGLDDGQRDLSAPALAPDADVNRPENIYKSVNVQNNFRVVVFAEFPASVTGRDQVNAQQALSGGMVHLNQERAADHTHFN